MTPDGIPPEIIERLQVNSKLARISLSEADFQGLVDKGFLKTVLAFEEYVTGSTYSDLPDYLKEWGVAGAGNSAGAENAPLLQPFEMPKNPPAAVKRGGPGW